MRLVVLFFSGIIACKYFVNPVVIGSSSHTHMEDSSTLTPTRLILHNVQAVGLGPHVDLTGSYYEVVAALDHPSATVDDIELGAHLMYNLYYSNVRHAGIKASALIQTLLTYAKEHPDIDTTHISSMANDLAQENLSDLKGFPLSTHADRLRYSPAQLMLYNVDRMGLGPHVDHSGSYHQVMAALDHPSSSLSDLVWGASLMYHLSCLGVTEATDEAKNLAYEFLARAHEWSESFLPQLQLLNLLKDLGELNIVHYYQRLAHADDLTPSQILHVRSGLYNMHTPEASELRQQLDQRYAELRSRSQTPPSTVALNLTPNDDIIEPYDNSPHQKKTSSKKQQKRRVQKRKEGRKNPSSKTGKDQACW